MDILGVSDWIDPLIYSEQLKYRMAGVDIIISCGDISSSYLDFIMSELNKPLYFVVGNHVGRSRISKTPLGQTALDMPSCFKNLHLKVHNYEGLLITGFQGSIWYNGGPFQYKQWEVYFRLLKILPRLIYNKIRYGRFIDIFVSHSAPFGVGDQKDPCHIGLKAFNLFIKLFKPKLFLHGHIHIYDRNENRIREYNGTKVVNCSGFMRTKI
ncbi:MAG: hypothetical protein A2086_12005 [Spirochaetes bacterium GWD1_27_9]|nr:MAG: hypothetical protein A2Z98_06885 [Spirochaetes bacterium GWB1_27_13]OHD22112.1 MAG: hypothetical protein A2Y34_13475 [Spirochaetes bacterium GWC1_27_15]OHD28957.1 MAG: hypothetical protein A2086_12005 [Spirochaetes bacterium GWD1_27_9]